MGGGRSDDSSKSGVKFRIPIRIVASSTYNSHKWLSSRVFIQFFLHIGYYDNNTMAFYPLSYFPHGGNGGSAPSPLGEGWEGGDRLIEKWSSN